MHISTERLNKVCGSNRFSFNFKIPTLSTFIFRGSLHLVASCLGCKDAGCLNNAISRLKWHFAKHSRQRVLVTQKGSINQKVLKFISRRMGQREGKKFEARRRSLLSLRVSGRWEKKLDFPGFESKKKRKKTYFSLSTAASRAIDPRLFNSGISVS